ncbi:glycoside hydrolase family 3 N-terminal domain-containing protein, partial [Trichococcus sp.]|uniref:glycoside hydrolase family 3 N-terminal domain-containing protein n=2 Tax=Trichococcus sp. TaxID=1985464 RepID=UPI003C79EDDE
MMDVQTQKIEALIGEMTLEEKIGQLQQCGPSLVGAFEVSFEELLDMMFDGRISQEEFGRLMSTAEKDFHEEDLRAGKIGSYNGVGDALTANRLQKIAVEESRLGIPLLFGYDVIHGFRTVTPIPLAESCAWDPDLWQKTARMSAEEATAAGVHMTFAPMVDVAKDARWGRVSEGAGEDTLLNGDYGAAKVRGFQGEDLSQTDAMAACLKHFAAYGAGEAGKDYNRVDMSKQRLWEDYLPAYKACVDAGARAVMPAFNDLNGVPCTVNEWLLRDVLRDEWGFEGITISDANAIAECVNHGVVADRQAAAKEALQAGIDMDMTSNVYAENLAGLIEAGEIAEDLLDQAVYRILKLKVELGLFENPYRTDEEKEKRTLVRPEYRALAREAATKSMVLLKNEAILPLVPQQKIAVFGELANDPGQMTGAWAIGAQENDCVSLVQALDAQGISYAYHPGIVEGILATAEIEKAAESADVVILAIGEQKEESGEAASKAEISLPAIQLELAEMLLRTGKPVVAVLFNGRPLAIPTVAEQVPAILEAWHPGIEAGNAILDIIYGLVNPSAKLTTTFPFATGQCPLYYDHISTGRPGGKSKFTSKYLDTPLEPVYPFGYGLSYTTFSYSGLQVETSGDAVLLTVTVTNSGDREGEEIVQCYVQDKVAKRARPVKQLKSYRKVLLQPGESITIEFEVPLEKLGYYDQKM